jgi:hypothetical protein
MVDQEATASAVPALTVPERKSDGTVRRSLKRDGGHG